MPTEEQLAVMKEHLATAQENLAKMRTELDLAKRAGFDVTALEEQYTTLEEKVRRARIVYNV